MQPRATSDVAELAAADAMLLRGCYDCLLDARTGYRGLRHRQRATRVFEVDLLIALREKELGLPPSDALAEASRIAADLPPALDAAHALRLVEAIPVQPLGRARRDVVAFNAAHAALDTHSGAELRWLRAGGLREPVRDYLAFAVACASPDPQSALPGDADRSPLLAYRVRICDLTATASLATVRAREPRFVETSFFLANTEMALFASAEAPQLAAHLAEVLARFPTSPAITYLAASYAQLIGDCPRALALYDRTLASQPEHEQALLGRVVCLTQLQQPDAANAVATQLIERVPDPPAEAYYWLAWNHRALGQLDAARRDIFEARQRLLEARVFSLAGIIAYDQHDLASAQADLEAALADEPADCVARTYLAVIQRTHARWPLAARGFDDATSCYTARVAAGTARLATLEAGAQGDSAYRARLAERLRGEAARDQQQEYRTALSGASCYVSAHQPDDARRLLALVSQEPALAADVATLRDRLTSGSSKRSPAR